AAAMGRFVPMIAVGLIGGALADRFGRRPLHLAVTFATGIVSAIQCALAWFDMLALWHIYVGVFMAGIHWASDMPLRRTMLGQSVPRALLGPAMALDSSGNNTTRLIGPLIGGASLALGGIAAGFL